MNSPGRPVPPGSTPLHELAHAIASALTLPNDVAAAVTLPGQPGDENQANGGAADELGVIP